jgi:hypothetical protein
MMAPRTRDPDRIEAAVIHDHAAGAGGLVMQKAGDTVPPVEAGALARRPDLAVQLGHVPAADRAAEHASISSDRADRAAQ